MTPAANEPVDPLLTPDLLVRAYASGVFPMGEGARVYWYAPDPRGVLPLDGFHVPSNLAKLVRRDPFTVTTDRAFGDVIRACADRAETWITPRVVAAYEALHAQGAAHSVECWDADGALAGGLYGVALGAAFFGESMFYRADNASKVALVHLVEQMKAGGFTLLDTQYTNPHLEQFGVTAIPRAAYERRLARALRVEATWWPLAQTAVAERV